jgi:hypothetical protein
MRKKRTRGRPPAPDRDKPPDATGLTIDWLGILVAAAETQRGSSAG